MDIKAKAKQLKVDIPAVFIALKDSETPPAAKIFAGLTVCYALSPIDLIPDFIPVLGYLDDLIILPALIALTIKLLPAYIWKRSKTKAGNIWMNRSPKRWYYSIPIVLVWLLIIIAVIKSILF